MKRILIVLTALLVIVLVASPILITRFEVYHPTGHVTNNQSGSITINVVSLLSITLSNDTIIFGGCALNVTKGYAILDSSLNESMEDNGNCQGGIFPDYIRLVNDGSIPANITVSFSRNGSSLFNDSDSWVAYKTMNGTDGGCALPQSTYLNVTQANNSYPVCDNLSFSPKNEIDLYIRTYINSSASSPDDLLLDFSGVGLI